jgi:omega-3 fatty acid desaturase (delta-15 desaturase)
VAPQALPGGPRLARPAPPARRRAAPAGSPRAADARRSRDPPRRRRRAPAPPAAPRADPPSRSSPSTSPAQGGRALANPPPFTLQDLRNAIPAHCFERSALRSFAFLALDVAVVAALAAGAAALSATTWAHWPLYWFAQGTMFWALFVVGHDAGHQSFSANRALNDFVGNVVHSTILVPYHGWRISHRTHHANHGHVENDESWHPVGESQYRALDVLARLGRLFMPTALFAYPFYLWKGSRGANGSHYDPHGDLFSPAEAPLVRTSNAFQLAWLGVLAACTYAIGFPAMAALYFVPYAVFVVWLDVVTYLHHHGPSDPAEEVPWYRGEEWNYMRGGLSTIDRDFGIFNKIHHDIGTHVVHHLFPQIPHYKLTEATAGAKAVMGPYYREPEPSPGLFPTHLFAPLVRSFSKDHFVDDEGDIVFYQKGEMAPAGLKVRAD